MRMVRVLGTLLLVAGGVLGLATPAQAASGPWRQVATGGQAPGNGHTCAINTVGSLYCWGYNIVGQTGDGTTNDPRLTLNRVGAAGVWVTVTTGGAHTCGITTAKNLYCWGYNKYGQAGDGTIETPRLTLHRVGASGVWASVNAGDQHTCGITTAKNLYCWGNDSYAQVGDGNTNDARLSLFRVGAAGVWASVTPGENHTCAITTAKNLYCWGYNGSGQVGDGTHSASVPRLTLNRVGASGVWASVTGGWGHTCGITTAKNLYCWGNNSSGEIGNGTSTTPQLSLHRVGAAGVWASVTAGGHHTCGITTANNLYCWGSNVYGQTGDGTTNTPRLTLNRVGAAGVWASADAGHGNTCGITQANNLYCWGINDKGQTGDGTTNTPRLTLFRVN